VGSSALTPAFNAATNSVPARTTAIGAASADVVFGNLNGLDVDEPLMKLNVAGLL